MCACVCVRACVRARVCVCVRSLWLKLQIQSRLPAAALVAGMPRHAWESDSDDSSSDEGAGWEDSDEEDISNPTPKRAAERMRDLIMKLWYESAISAENACELCYWGSKGGMHHELAQSR